VGHGRAWKLTTQLRLVPMSRMNGVITRLHIYICMMWTGTLFYWLQGSVAIMYRKFYWEVTQPCVFQHTELFRACGQTDRHDEANSRFAQCFERAQEFNC